MWERTTTLRNIYNSVRSKVYGTPLPWFWCVVVGLVTNDKWPAEVITRFLIKMQWCFVLKIGECFCE